MRNAPIQAEVNVGLLAKYGPWTQQICQPLHHYCRPVWLFHALVSAGSTRLNYQTFAPNVTKAPEDLIASLDALARGEVDVVGSPRFILTADRLRDGVPFIYPASISRNSMFIRRPDLAERSQDGLEEAVLEYFDVTLFKPFSLLTWVFLLLFLISAIVCSWLFQRKLSNLRNRRRLSRPEATKVVNLTRTFKLLIMKLATSMLCLIVGIAYSANLSANIVTPAASSLPFKDLVGLAPLIANGEFTMAMDAIKTGRLALLNREATIPGYEAVGEAFKINPPHVLQDHSDSVNACKLTATSKRKKYVLIAMEAEARANCGSEFFKLLEIPFKIDLRMMYTYLVSPRRRDVIDRLNYGIMSGVHMIEEHRYDRFVCGTHRSCFEEARAQQEKTETVILNHHAIGLIGQHHLRVIYLIYSGICMMALIVLGCENLLAAWLRRQDGAET